jgi:ABC-type Fe3+ transport system permease subunit
MLCHQAHHQSDGGSCRSSLPFSCQTTAICGILTTICSISLCGIAITGKRKSASAFPGCHGPALLYCWLLGCFFSFIFFSPLTEDGGASVREATMPSSETDGFIGLEKINDDLPQASKRTTLQTAAIAVSAAIVCVAIGLVIGFTVQLAGLRSTTPSTKNIYYDVRWLSGAFLNSLIFSTFFFFGRPFSMKFCGRHLLGVFFYPEEYLT